MPLHHKQQLHDCLDKMCKLAAKVNADAAAHALIQAADGAVDHHQPVAHPVSHTPHLPETKGKH